jgi:hypothetical protein
LPVLYLEVAGNNPCKPSKTRETSKFHNARALDGPFFHHPLILETLMPAKGYVPQPGRAPGMPERPHAKNFNRKLGLAEAQILAAAGNGSKTEGFRNLLDLYWELHGLGYRSDMSITEFIYTKAGN